MVKVIIEMPEGDDRRRHFNKDKTELLDLHPLKDVITANGGRMPVNYGFIPGTWTEADQDELDILVLSKEKVKPGQEMEAEPIAVLIRADGDNKVIAVDETEADIKRWEDIPKETWKKIEEFFTFHDPILEILDPTKTKEYIKNSQR